MLVFTVAVKAELPLPWLSSMGIPVYTLKALRSGALSRIKSAVLILISGVGNDNSQQMALWIVANINPDYVINIGSAGACHSRLTIGQWLMITEVSNENDGSIELPDHLPIPKPCLVNASLVTLKRPQLENIKCAGDAVDMECYGQAKIFQKQGIAFYALKFITDHANLNTKDEFGANIKACQAAIKELLLNTPLRLPDAVKISVIIPIYNRAHLLERCLQSVCQQSLKADEIIVVNDASSDHFKTTIKPFEGQITLLNMAENKGVSAARNLGIRYAKNDWIAFLDSDDEWCRDKLKTQWQYLIQHPYYQIMQSEEIWIRNEKRVNACQHHQKKSGWIWQESLKQCFISPSSVLVKKSLLIKYGCFDESLPACEDYDLWLKITRDHIVGLDVQKNLIKYGGHEDQLSKKYPVMDKFRVQTLLNILSNESSVRHQLAIKMILSKKLSILIQGSKKRNLTTQADYYQKLLPLCQ